MRLEGAIFDFDGTLADTLPLAIEAFQQAIEQISGCRYTVDEIVAQFGPSEVGVIRQFVPERWQECLAAYLHHYEQSHITADLKPFPGIEACLRLLRDRGIPCAVATGKGSGSAAFSLQHVGLAGYFDPVETGSADGPIKPALIRRVLSGWGLPPDRVFYIGDSPSDIGDARSAGVVPLGAAWASTAHAAELAVQQPLAVFTGTDAFFGWLQDCLDQG